MSKALVILCTCPDVEVAGELSRSLVDQGLAACVNILPAIRSIYTWQGEVQDDGEALMVIKTMESGFGAVESWLLEHHPYEVPEIVAIEADRVSHDYLQWLSRGVSG